MNYDLGLLPNVMSLEVGLTKIIIFEHVFILSSFQLILSYVILIIGLPALRVRDRSDTLINSAVLDSVSLLTPIKLIYI